jgi:hypothetical protein
MKKLIVYFIFVMLLSTVVSASLLDSIFSIFAPKKFAGLNTAQNSEKAEYAKNITKDILYEKGLVCKMYDGSKIVDRNFEDCMTRLEKVRQFISDMNVDTKKGIINLKIIQIK